MPEPTLADAIASAKEWMEKYRIVEQHYDALRTANSELGSQVSNLRHQVTALRSRLDDATAALVKVCLRD